MTSRPGAARRWWLLLLTWAASFAAGGLILALLFWHHGRRQRAVALLALTAVSLLGLLLALWRFDWPWQRWALTILAINGIAGIVYTLEANRLASHPDLLPVRSLWSSQALLGASLGLVLGPAIGAASVLTAAILLDPWLSTQVPINAGLITLGIELIAAILSLGFVGPILGASFARRASELSPLVIIRLCLSAWGVCVIFLVCQTLLFGVLSFQSAGMAQADILHVGKRLLLWCLFLFGVAPATCWVALKGWMPGAFRRLLTCGTIIFFLHATWVIYLGLLGYGCLVGGRWAEQRNAIPVALKLYEKGLVTRATPMINSYLQHRVGLLNHKLGHREQAMLAFERVVTIYNANRRLVEEATDYLEDLKHKPESSPRVVMAGIEAKTEYKSAYCAPNSLALVLWHWGYRVNPKQIGEAITSFRLGSSLLDLVWYTEQFPLQHRLVPFASLDMIKKSVAQEIPVLAYLPGHVLAIFGYDEGLQTLVAYDTASWDVWVDFPIRRFEEEWKKTNRLLGVVESRPKTAPVSQPSHFAMVHDLLAQEEYSASPYRAQRHLEMALALDPSWFPGAIALYHNYPAARSDFNHRFPVDQLLDQVKSSIPDYAYRGSLSLRQALELAVLFGYSDKVRQIEERLRPLGLLAPEFLGPIGLGALNQGQAQAGAAALGQALPPQPLALAVALERTGAAEAAMAQYAEVVSSHWLQPTDRWLAMHKLSELGQRFKAWDRIIEAGRPYLEQCPYDLEAQLGYARSLLEMAKAKPNEAEKLRAQARKALATVERLLGESGLGQELRALREDGA